MIDEIIQAICNKRRLTLHYPPGQRLVEPHVLGVSREGNILLRAYQVEGASASGEHKSWKLFRIDRAGTVMDSGQEFDGPRPEYNPDDSAMKGGITARL